MSCTNITPETLENHIELLWKEFRAASYMQCRILQRKRPYDFYDIGVFVAFHSQLPDEEDLEVSFAETLQTVLPKDYPPTAMTLMVDFLRPWIERFSISS